MHVCTQCGCRVDADSCSLHPCSSIFSGEALPFLLEICEEVKMRAIVRMTENESHSESKSGKEVASDSERER